MMREGIELAAHAAELAGVLVILAGMLLATGGFLFRRGDAALRYRRYRQDLGRAILLGLEILVAADIIGTVALAPTMNSVLVLALIVAIRTFLSWSLALELDGRWPWQRGAEPAAAPA